MRSCDMLESLQTGGGITTIRIPILGFDTVLDDPCYTSSLNFPVSVETLEVSAQKQIDSQTYDGAAVVAGQLNGVQSRVKEIVPEETFIHCYAEKLNLVFSQSVSFIGECHFRLLDFLGLLDCLPVDTVFSENEDIQTIQIDESLSAANLDSAIQPMIIASTDSQGNCFVTLQDEQTFNSSTWTAQNEIVGSEETLTRGIFTSLAATQRPAVPSPPAIGTTVPIKTPAVRSKTTTATTRAIINPSAIGIAAASATTPTMTIPTSTTTVTIPVTIPATLTAASTITTATTTPPTIRKIPMTYRAKTDILPLVNATEVPNVTKIVNNRNSVGIRSFMRCGRSRMIADHLTSIPVSEFKSQLNDTSDIIGKLDVAPPTKRLMNLLQWKGIGKLFASPGHKFMSEKLMRLFTRHLRTKLLPSEETFSDMELLPVGYKPEVDPTKIKRITRRRRYPEAEEYQRRMFQEQMKQTLETLVANGQTHIQTVYLDGSDAFKDPTPETLQVLIESNENDSFLQNDPSKVVGVFGNETTNDSSIIVIHNSQDTDQNIEVLLAAAGESGLSSDGFHQVFICNTENDSESVLPCASSIIIVPNDPLSDAITETVVSS
ncbi:Uncharacterized protein GBIM_00941 [Gryllus bimaculatus]|nr:Uncharacterized protein GBIM_00941 [Gryllus bimaculatus]